MPSAVAREASCLLASATGVDARQVIPCMLLHMTGVYCKAHMLAETQASCFDLRSFQQRQHKDAKYPGYEQKTMVFNN